MEDVTEIKVSELQAIVPFYQKLMQTGMDAEKALSHAKDISILEKELAIIGKAEESVLKKGKELADEDGKITLEQEKEILEELRKLHEKVIELKGLAKITVFPKEVTPREINILLSIGLYSA